MTPQDIEAELSYAYLHAVASRAGIACHEANRSHDNAGVDATLRLVKDFGPGTLTEISLHVQLKATIRTPAIKPSGLSYYLDDLTEYDRLRANSKLPPRILAVLFLPSEPQEWLESTADELILRRSAYWVSLLGARASDNQRGQTVYLPQSQRLSSEGLLDLFGRVARSEELQYAS